MPKRAPIHVPVTRIDQIVADTCYRFASPKVEPAFRVITWLADEKVMVGAAGAAWLCGRALSRDRALARQLDQMMCSVAIAAAAPHVLKLLFVRERPDRTRIGRRRKGIPKSGNALDSFPSGHAVHVGALAGALSRIAPDRPGLIWSTAVALAGTRVLLLAHHVTDVLAGGIVGLTIDRIVRGAFALADDIRN